jgi:hypothetical protein
MQPVHASPRSEPDWHNTRGRRTSAGRQTSGNSKQRSTRKAPTFYRGQRSEKQENRLTGQQNHQTLRKEALSTQHGAEVRHGEFVLWPIRSPRSEASITVPIERLLEISQNSANKCETPFARFFSSCLSDRCSLICLSRKPARWIFFEGFANPSPIHATISERLLPLDRGEVTAAPPNKTTSDHRI